MESKINDLFEHMKETTKLFNKEIKELREKASGIERMHKISNGPELSKQEAQK